MKGFIRKWTFELIWIVGNLLFIFKYFIDKYTIQCEPCIDISNCPPCQTNFMRDFWIYMTFINILTVIGMIISKQFTKTNK
jgi:hypothetical protein